MLSFYLFIYLIFRDVIEAEEIRLDRWTVVFRPLGEEGEGDGKVSSNFKNLGKLLIASMYPLIAGHPIECPSLGRERTDLRHEQLLRHRPRR